MLYNKGKIKQDNMRENDGYRDKLRPRKTENDNLMKIKEKNILGKMNIFIALSMDQERCSDNNKKEKLQKNYAIV